MEKRKERKYYKLCRLREERTRELGNIKCIIGKDNKISTKKMKLLKDRSGTLINYMVTLKILVDN